MTAPRPRPALPNTLVNTFANTAASSAAEPRIGGGKDNVVIRVATRASPLARWQADHVAALLARTGHRAELVLVSTLGDRTQSAATPLHSIGGQGVFVKEVQAAVLDGRADIAVHSAKDVPTAVPPGLVIAAVPERGDVRDALVGSTLETLAEGAVVATGSVRRRTQLAAIRPDLRFVELRGNMHARVARVDAGRPDRVDAVIVAAIALERLDLTDQIDEYFDANVLVPQAGQGAIAVECRADDDALRRLLRGIEDHVSRTCVDAERAFLLGVGGGCELPVGAWARPTESGWQFTGVLTATGGTVLREERTVGNPGELLAAATATAGSAMHRAEQRGGRL